MDFFKLDLDNKASIIALEGCFLGDALTLVVDFLRKHFMGTIQSRVEAIAKEKIPSLVSEKLDEKGQISKQLRGFNVQAALDRVDTDQDGVSLAVGLSVAPIAAGSQCGAVQVSSPPVCGRPLPVFNGQPGTMFSAGISANAINRALHAVWRSGMLCVDDSQLSQPTLKDGLSKVGSLLGLPASTRIGVALQMQRPPQVAITPLTGLRFEVPSMTVRLQMTHGDGAVESACMNAAVTVAASPWVQPQDSTIALDLHQMKIDQFELVACNGVENSTRLHFDPARLQRFVGKVALPMLRKRLDETRLSPSLINVAGFLVELKSVQMAEGYMVVSLDAHDVAPTGNTVPPETLTKTRVPSVVGPQMLKILVGGQDDVTKEALLQYKVRINGGEWSEATYGGRVDVAVSKDVSLIEVAAVDVDGNVDPTPLSIPVLVDDTPPNVSITGRPDSLVPEGSATVAFTASDDRAAPGGMTYRAKLMRVPDGGGVAQVIAERSLPGQMRVTFDGLAGGVYKIRIEVSDDVGNVTSRDVGFVVEGGGCSVANSPLGAFGPLSLLLAFFVLVGRRRKG